MHLTPTQQKFILHWGEMGTKWGINRTVAQIHALLFVSDKPLHAEEIAETLSVARSNVSTSIRELQNWNLVRNVHVFGDRRDHFETLKDVWETYGIVMDERKRREIDPTIALLRECVAETENPASRTDQYTHERLSHMLDFVDTMSTWYHQIRRLPRDGMIRFCKAGSTITGMFTGRRRKTKV